MDVLRTHYTTYDSLLRISGLCPFDQSFFAKIQRTTFALAMLCSIIVQFATLAWSDFSSENLLITLSFGGLLMLLLVRYIGFIYCFPTVRFICHNILTDYTELKNPIEMEILTKHLNASKRVTQIYLLLGLLTFISGGSIVLSPIIFNFILPPKESVSRSLRTLGLYVDHEQYTYLLSLLHAFGYTCGALVVTCSESMVSVCAYYVCGLFKITSYRICNAIDMATKRFVSKNNVNSHASIREAMDMHRKSFKLVERI
ncbi:uncharacterized protein LOC143150680 [Ptiloglossa arizonensis]|uniref:uncharacterized protein LOC143150680 n=1 Tax=Ptiloglossa arizonensis TaxID=3350558 RepID=UPI003FA1326B